MPILWNVSKRIDQYWQGQLSGSADHLPSRQMALDPFLRKRVFSRKKIYRLITLSGRRELKGELRRIQPERSGHQAPE